MRERTSDRLVVAVIIDDINRTQHTDLHVLPRSLRGQSFCRDPDRSTLQSVSKTPNDLFRAATRRRGWPAGAEEHLGDDVGPMYRALCCRRGGS